MKKIMIDLPEGYTIHFAENSDIPDIMTFFDKYWKKNHILARNRKFFEYEFCRNGEVCVVLLKDAEKKIKGTLGYIPYGDENRDIFMVMWKVVETNDLFLGTSLLYYLVENGRCRHIYTSGLNKSTISIYKYLGLQVVSLTHYYMANPYVKQNVAKIRVNKNICISESTEGDKWHECEMNEFRDSYSVPIAEDRIRKSCEYVLHRYYNNPIYNYKVYKMSTNSRSFFVVFRIQTYKSSRILRVIDYLGDEFLVNATANIVWKIMIEEKCEYADMYAYGLNHQLLQEAGFDIIKENSEDIVPNYFSPFKQENIEIRAMFEKGMQPYIFKGDGDQDRPS